MKSVKYRKVQILTFVVIFFILIIAIFGYVNIKNSCKIINSQSNSNLIFLVENIRKSVDEYFSKTEEETEHCKKMIELTFDYNKFKKIAPFAYKFNKYKIPYLENYLDTILNPLLLYSAKHVNGLNGIYFIFNYSLIPHKDIIGTWYTHTNINDEFKITDNGPTSDMYTGTEEELEWYFRPKKYKKGIWSEPYKDMNLKIDMITYSVPVYSKNNFIGVIGIDISMTEIEDFINKFKIYKTGKTYLIDKNNKIIFASNYKRSTSTYSIDENLYKCIFNSCSNEILGLDSHEVKLIKSASGKNLFAITKLYNNFFLVIEVKTKELYGETNKLVTFTVYTLILAILIALLAAIRTYAKVKKINNELIHKEKLISIGTIAAEVAHEINTPLGYLNCNVDTLKKFLAKIKDFMLNCENEFDSIILEKKHFKNEIENIRKLRKDFKIDYILDSFDEIIDESKEGISRMSSIVTNLKNYSKDNRNEDQSEENLEKIIEETLMVLNNKITDNIKIIKCFNNIPNILCNKNHLKQVFINLIDNAIYAVKKKNYPQKQITIKTSSKNQYAIIEIEDNGIGIEKSNLKKIFETFYTTKAEGEGTGLGLSITYEIITKKHNGEILVESKKGSGTKFTIKIPYKTL